MNVPDKVHRLPAVELMTGLKRGALRQSIADGIFPKPIKILGQGGRAVGWLESDLVAFLDKRKQERDAVFSLANAEPSKEQT